MGWIIRLHSELLLFMLCKVSVFVPSAIHVVAFIQCGCSRLKAFVQAALCWSVWLPVETKKQIVFSFSSSKMTTIDVFYISRSLYTSCM